MFKIHTSGIKSDFQDLIAAIFNKRATAIPSKISLVRT